MKESHDSTIRLAVTDDISAINKIYNQAVNDGLRTAHTEPVSLKDRRIWFANHRKDAFPIFIAEINEQIAGWISISPYRSDRQALNEVIEISYYVDYSHHEKGLGSRLMDRALHFCQQAPYRIAVAILISQNQASIALLKKFGFSEGGRIPDAIRYEDTFRDHLYFFKKLQN